MTWMEMFEAGMITPENRKCSKNERNEVEKIAHKAFCLLKDHKYRFTKSEPCEGGELFSADAFIENEKLFRVPMDGRIGEILIDGKVTNICVKEMGGQTCYPPVYYINLEQLLEIDGKVEVKWFQKKQ
jgi:hypothetical protein